jgi:hypothetical protein
MAVYMLQSTLSPAMRIVLRYTAFKYFLAAKSLKGYIAQSLHVSTVKTIYYNLLHVLNRTNRARVHKNNTAL